jgi:hypothetical protein
MFVIKKRNPFIGVAGGLVIWVAIHEISIHISRSVAGWLKIILCGSVSTLLLILFILSDLKIDRKKT